MRRKLFCVVILLVLGWGAYLRLWGLGGRPFWRDEASVAILVEQTAWGDFFRQSELPAPPLLAVAAKLLNSFVSPAEWAMRLPAALAGVVLLPLSYLAARRLRAPRSIALAGMALCTCSMMLVVWSRELKQYQLEACLSVVLAVLVFQARRGPTAGPGRSLTAAGIVLVCLVGPWLGYGAVFPAAALTGMLVILPPVSRGHRRALPVGLLGLAALAGSTWLLHHLVASGQEGNEGLIRYMGRWFIDPGSLRSWLRAGTYGLNGVYWVLFPDNWTISTLWQVSAALPVALLALLGLACWPRQGRAEMAWWTVVPCLLLLVAAIAQRYPFGITRMMVFAAPPLVIALAMGLAVACRFFAPLIAQRSGTGLVISVLIALSPSVYLAYLPTQYRYFVHHDFPTVLEVLAEQHRPGERVLVGLNSVQCVRYYGRDLGIPFSYTPTTAGTLAIPGYDYDDYVRQVARGAGGRWWLLVTSEIRGRRAGLMDIVEQEGYRLQLVAEAGNDSPYGKAQLVVATRGRGSSLGTPPRGAIPPAARADGGKTPGAVPHTARPSRPRSSRPDD